MSSVAASRLAHIVPPVFLGLTPQAMNMSPLRGFVVSPHEILTQPRVHLPSRLHLMGMVVTRKRVPPLPGPARSPHMGASDPHTRVADSRLRLVRIILTGARVPRLHGSGGSHHRDSGAPTCRFHNSRRAPKARQTFSLGREPQKLDRAPSVKPRSGDRHLAWGVSPRKRRVQLRPAPKGRQTFNLGCERQDDWRKKWQEHSAT